MSGRSALAGARIRDGDLCFYCHGRVDDEWGVAAWLVEDGPETAANAVVAHARCAHNHEGLSAREKINVHTKKAVALALTGAEEDRLAVADPGANPQAAR